MNHKPSIIPIKEILYEHERFYFTHSSVTSRESSPLLRTNPGKDRLRTRIRRCVGTFVAIVLDRVDVHRWSSLYPSQFHPYLSCNEMISSNSCKQSFFFSLFYIIPSHIMKGRFLSCLNTVFICFSLSLLHFRPQIKSKFCRQTTSHDNTWLSPHLNLVISPAQTKELYFLARNRLQKKYSYTG